MPGIEDSIAKQSPPQGILSSVQLAPLTTMGVGGPSRWFSDIRDAESLAKAYRWAKGQGLPIFFLGDGSNVLFADLEFPGLVLRNRTSGRERSGSQILVAGGENLGDLIRWTNQHQLSGMERMYGIPGTVAGALVGNAGAYGQEICESVTEARVWSADGGIRQLTRPQLEFGYRHSVFKERKDCFILDCTLDLKESREKLQEISDSILETRLAKYPRGLKCPGSFFKNVLATELPDQARLGIPEDFAQFGKIPAGKLLEAVGAKGARSGHALFAKHHANLLVNEGNATSKDIVSLANKYADRVLERFHLSLEPEIFIVDDQKCLQQ